MQAFPYITVTIDITPDPDCQMTEREMMDFRNWIEDAIEKHFESATVDEFDYNVNKRPCNIRYEVTRNRG